MDTTITIVVGDIEVGMDDKPLSILIPIIRQIVPTIIASEIVGVHPMSPPFSFGKASIYFTHELHEFGKHLLHIHFDTFGVLGESVELLDKIETYIVETFGDRVQKTNGLNYIFDEEKDLTMFLLKWAK